MRMHSRRQSLRNTAVAFAAAVLPSSGQPNSLRVPFQYAAGLGSLLIRARINGKPAVLILDTGASHIIVRPAFLGIAPEALARPHARGGITGDAVADEVTLELGGQVWQRRRVSVMDLTNVLAPYKEPVDGLLGLDFLFDFSQAALDFQQRVITCRK